MLDLPLGMFGVVTNSLLIKALDWRINPRGPPYVWLELLRLALNIGWIRDLTKLIIRLFDEMIYSSLNLLVVKQLGPQCFICNWKWLLKVSNYMRCRANLVAWLTWVDIHPFPKNDLLEYFLYAFSPPIFLKFLKTQVWNIDWNQKHNLISFVLAADICWFGSIGQKYHDWIHSRGQFGSYFGRALIFPQG